MDGRIDTKMHARGGQIVAASITVSRDALLESAIKSRPDASGKINLVIQSDREIPVVEVDPPGIKNPYLWRATLRVKGEPDDIIVQGDFLPVRDGEGKLKPKNEWHRIMKPKEIPQGQVKRLELLPAIEGSAWSPVEMDFGPEDSVDYIREIDTKIQTTTGHKQGSKDRLIFRGCVKATLEKRGPDGRIEVRCAYPDGSYEEIVTPAEAKE